VQSPVLVYVLTGFAAAIVVFTRVRLGRARGKTSRSSAASGLLTIYATSGLLAVIGWVTFLYFPEDGPAGDPLVGVVALFFWWVAALVGLRMMTRRPARGKHAAPSDGATSGHTLLLLAQLGLLAAVAFFTWAYTTATV
jgi:hypothetical protein